MATTTGKTRPILTVEELMERWSVSRDTIFQFVDNPDNPLDSFQLGIGEKNRTKVRFRIEDVEEFERRNLRRAVRPPEAEPVGKPAWFKGEVLLDLDAKPRRRKAAGG